MKRHCYPERFDTADRYFISISWNDDESLSRGTIIYRQEFFVKVFPLVLGKTGFIRSGRKVICGYQSDPGITH
jgi:hypothetical protein